MLRANWVDSDNIYKVQSNEAKNGWWFSIDGRWWIDTQGNLLCGEEFVDSEILLQGGPLAGYVATG